MKTFKEFYGEQAKSEYIIYFDMDGVLADFVERIESVTGESIDFLMKDQTTFKKLKSKLVADNFFASLKPMEGIKLLKELVRDGERVEILSSVGQFESEKVAKQKKAWLKQHLGFSPKFNYTTSSKDKAKYAKSNTILIDDRTKSTVPFKAAGGIVILHKSYQATKKQLMAIIK